MIVREPLEEEDYVTKMTSSKLKGILDTQTKQRESIEKLKIKGIQKMVMSSDKHGDIQ